MKKSKIVIYVLFTLMLLINSISCFADAKARSNLTKESEMTVGIVQKEIKVGMAQDEVATALGSPNIVTRDSDGKETWIYDKIGTEAKQSSGGGYFTLLILGFGKSNESYSSTQKTLTVIIKFNDKNCVESFSYHSSKF